MNGNNSGTLTMTHAMSGPDAMDDLIRLANQGHTTQEPGAHGSAPQGAGVNAALAELDGLVGLEEVKEQVRRLVDGIRINKMKEEAGQPVPPVSYHIVFTGNPGTGKTTVARILAAVYREFGILSQGILIETGRDELVSSYIGDTAKRTKYKINEAKGGILFIDEAYSLTVNRGEKDFGFEAVDTLVQEMEKNRDDLVVIVAGYPAQMTEFLRSNPGLSSRFTKTINFPDYKPEAMLEIFTRSLCGKYEYVLTGEAAYFAKIRFEKMYKLRTRNFGNARVVRQFFEDTLSRQNDRLAREPGLAAAPDRKKKLATFELEDLMTPKELQEHKHPRPIAAILSELDAMVGLAEVKQMTHELANWVRFQRELERNKLPGGLPAVHLVFAGNPGTGKTTVARMLGELFYKIGLLQTDTVIETDRSALAARYVGQTAPLVNDVCDRAMGGVLFIDEAYSLAGAGGAEGDFGREAVEALVKRMEDDRGKFVVIAAGYKENMEQFLESNPGLRSRFTHTVNFPDYSPDELFAIFAGMVKKGGFALTEKAREAARKRIEAMYGQRGGHFANARSVRNVYDGILRRKAGRLTEKPGRDELRVILPEDIEIGG